MPGCQHLLDRTPGRTGGEGSAGRDPPVQKYKVRVGEEVVTKTLHQLDSGVWGVRCGSYTAGIKCCVTLVTLVLISSVPSALEEQQFMYDEV